jgi:signal transduction histidine kinase/CheY-like chemotaxis protein
MHKFKTSADGIDRSLIDAQRKKLFIKGALPSSFVAVFAAWIIALIASDPLGWAVVSPWATFTSLFFIARFLVLRRWMQDPNLDINSAKVTWFVSAAGWLITIPMALGYLYYSPQFSLANKALTSMMLVGWIGGGMAAQTAYPRWSPPWVLPLVVAIAGGWLVWGGVLGYTIAIAAVFTCGLLALGLLAGAKALEQSLVAQEENHRLALVIEEQKRLVENALISKSSFLAAASHDLRQPALGIAMLVSALKEAKTIDSARAIGVTAEKAVSAMSRILDSLLDFSRLDSGQIVVTPVPTNVQQILSGLMEEFKPQLRPAVKFASHLSVSMVQIDPQLFEQIARNLISNAIKFTYTGKIQITSGYDGKNLLLEISDTGVGIPMQDRDRVFEEYFQVRNPIRDRTHGLGLGLSIVKKSVELLAGTVEVQSQIGAGTTVRAMIPAAIVDLTKAVAPTTVGTTEATQSLDQAPSTILLIDDDPIVRESFAAALQVRSVIVLAAANAEQAIQFLEANPALRTAFVDYQISDMYDGLRLIKVLRGRWPDLRCHLITGDPRREVIDAAIQADVKLLMKPVPFETVIELSRV